MLWGAGILVVVSDGMLVFYLLFELLLILMYWYLVRHALHARGAHALHLLMVYTVVGSGVLMIVLLYIYMLTGMLTS